MGAWAIAATSTKPFWMPGADEIAFLAPLWALVGTLVVLLLGATFVFGRNWRAAAGVTVAGALLTAWLCYRGFSLEPEGYWAGLSPSGSPPMLIADQFTYFFIGLIAVFLALIAGLWYLGHSAAPDRQPGNKIDAIEFFVLFVGSAFGMALMVSTANLLMIILAVEMASLPSYAIAGFRKKHRLAAEASVKYVLFGAVTSAIMIYGVSLLYGQFGTLDLLTIGQAIAAHALESGGGMSVLTGVSIFALLVGVAFKVSAVPFHFWCPDVFEGASIEVTTWLSVASKAAGIGLMLRIMSVLGASFERPELLQDTLKWVSLAIAVMAAVTCTVGNLAAYWQTNMKRLLAFSSIAHAGYMLMAVAVLWYRTGIPTHPAFSAVAFYLVVYLFMNLGAFAIVAMVYWSTGKETIDAFNGLGRRNPVLAVAMVIFMFSLVGMPPFGGFVAKVWLLVAIYDAGLIWLVAVAVFNTLISLFYYARVAKAMYFVKDEGLEPVRAPWIGTVLVAACSILVLLTGTISADRLHRYCDLASSHLYAIGQDLDEREVSELADESPPEQDP
ncbi:MAG: NADH-quinone oxidoreductase subunit N [Planctomycetota bacterium]|nr:NADH-quinone oxidoreductase subunit N [Planctomycetota bacterium]